MFVLDDGARAREVDLVVTGPDGIGVVPLALLGP
jgi:hypothetical protein